MKPRQAFGQIARHYGANLPLVILEGDIGFYIGTREDDLPFSRESEEYFTTRALAQLALANGSRTQRKSGYADATEKADFLSVSRR